LDDEDLTFITLVLDSFSYPKTGANELRRSSCVIRTPEGATAQAKAEPMTPQKFNQKFNQNLTKESQGSNKFSCFPTIEEEEDTFSDGEETFSDKEDTLSESDSEKFEFEDKTPRSSIHSTFLDEEDTLSESDSEIFEFEDQTPCSNIHSISKERGTIFSAWRPYIPPEPVFQSLSARSWWSASSLLASLSPEPTLTRISSINCSNSTMGQTPIPVSTTHTKLKMKQSPQQGWTPFKPATKCYKHNWNKPWPKSSITCKGTRNLWNEFHDRPERSKPFKPWKPQLPFSDKANRNLNTKSQNMPPETGVGNVLQPFTRCPSRIYSTTMSGTITTKTPGRKSDAGSPTKYAFGR
jgi:hypothetical protein